MATNSKNLHTYAMLFRVNWIAGRAHPVELLARFAFFALILLIFHLLWTSVGREQIRLHVRPDQMIWYLFVTEWILLSVPHVHLDIEDDIKSGAISYHLIRPISYLKQKFIESTAEMIRRMLVFGIAGASFASMLTSKFPPYDFYIVAVPLGIASGCLAIIFLITIGISAIWIHETSPLYLIWQKLLFILGGLLFPISFYPDWLYRFAEYLPFAAILYLPATAALKADTATILFACQQTILWSIALVFLCDRLYRTAIKRFEVAGG